MMIFSGLTSNTNQNPLSVWFGLDRQHRSGPPPSILLHPSPCSLPLPHHLIRPKRFTREEIRWRSPGLCWGSKLLQRKNTRSVEYGKADVRGTGRLAIKSWQMQKEKKRNEEEQEWERGFVVGVTGLLGCLSWQYICVGGHIIKPSDISSNEKC